jgi:putative DNA primase/helicase
MDPVVESKLSIEQRGAIARMRIRSGGRNFDSLASLWADGILDGRTLNVPNLVKAVLLMGPIEIDKSGSLWAYADGVWKPDAERELTRRVELCTGDRFRSDHAHQAQFLIQSREPMITGLGPSHLINVRNGMLDWFTGELIDHSPDYYSTYQLTVPWNPDAQCTTIDSWMQETFSPDLHALLWQVMGVVIYPGMGPQQAVALIGGGNNGKSTYQRLCAGLLPASAYVAIDPRDLATNRFASAELFGKTANICGDIERFTFNSTAEFKKITGDDPIRAERKHKNPFTFTSQATNLFSGNKMPPSRDATLGWFRRWHIVPLDRQISGPPNRALEPALHAELEGALVRAVQGLREVMAQGGYDRPEACLAAAREYEYSCNSTRLFISEKVQFGSKFKAPVSREAIYGAYKAFCSTENLEVESRPKFYEALADMGKPHLREQWTSDTSRKRGYVGLACDGIWPRVAF